MVVRTGAGSDLRAAMPRPDVTLPTAAAGVYAVCARVCEYVCMCECVSSSFHHAQNARAHTTHFSVPYDTIHISLYIAPGVTRFSHPLPLTSPLFAFP